MLARDQLSGLSEFGQNQPVLFLKIPPPAANGMRRREQSDRGVNLSASAPIPYDCI
jgi:hypothetical protein